MEFYPCSSTCISFIVFVIFKWTKSMTQPAMWWYFLLLTYLAFSCFKYYLWFTPFLWTNEWVENWGLNSYENVDYMSFFENQEPEKISYTSVMRSSATFPFVMPMVTLPISTGIQLMDAGLRDNYRGKITSEYINALDDWIKKNTSGVIIVQLHDTQKILANEKSKTVSLFNKFTLSFWNMYSNFPRTQDFNQDQIFKKLEHNLEYLLDVISFNQRQDSKDKISLSWHLTKQEKVKIIKAFDSPANQNALKKLILLLEWFYFFSISTSETEITASAVQLSGEGARLGAKLNLINKPSLWYCLSKFTG